jgi:hypothetical protein
MVVKIIGIKLPKFLSNLLKLKFIYYIAYAIASVYVLALIINKTYNSVLVFIILYLLMNLITKNEVLKLAGALGFTTCQVCMSKFKLLEGNSSASSTDSSTSSDESGNSSEDEKYYKNSAGNCVQMNGDNAKTVCNANNCSGTATITKACNKITCYSCQKNSQCTNTGC